MNVGFDSAKNERNIRERGLSFERVVDFDWGEATIIADDRKNYPELRLVAVGYLDVRLHVMCFTPQRDGIRVISFRKANEREARKYGKAIKLD